MQQSLSFIQDVSYKPGASYAFSYQPIFYCMHTAVSYTYLSLITKSASYAFSYQPVYYCMYTSILHPFVSYNHGPSYAFSYQLAFYCMQTGFL